MKVLVGKWFHSFYPDNDDVKGQGHILAMVSEGVYLVELYSWLDGSPNTQKLVNFSEMAKWQFYDTAEEMRSTWIEKLEFHQSYNKKMREEARETALKMKSG